jgi:hypothetical protein
MICTPHQVLFGVQIKKNAIGGACGKYGGAGKVHTGFWCGNLRNETIGRLKRAWKDNIQMDIFKK